MVTNTRMAKHASHYTQNVPVKEVALLNVFLEAWHVFQHVVHCDSVHILNEVIKSFEVFLNRFQSLE